jgi:ASCH domain
MERTPRDYALSLKQPWAALLAHGRKTIEVRRWPTARRGRILIHAARVPDERPEVWALVPEELREAAQLLGGIVGEGELTGCLPYRTLEAFTADQARHLNDPAWFVPRKLYGFIFANLSPLPFRRYPGWMRFFPVDDVMPRSGSREES